MEVNDSDLDFIAEETGLDRERIRLWTLAFVVGRDAAVIFQETNVIGTITRVGVNSTITKGGSVFAILYGWFRLGLPTEPAALWSTPTERLLATLNTAIAKGIVPPGAGADLDGLSKLIGQIKADRMLQAPALGTATTLGDLLATSPVPLSLDQQRSPRRGRGGLEVPTIRVGQIYRRHAWHEAEGVAATVACTACGLVR